MGEATGALLPHHAKPGADRRLANPGNVAANWVFYRGQTVELGFSLRL